MHHRSTPIYLAAGVYGRDGYGLDCPEELELTQLAGIVLATATLQPRTGSLKPPVWHPDDGTPQYLLRAASLRNPGVKALLARDLPRQRRDLNFVISIAGGSTREWADLAGMLTSDLGFMAAELNLSSPNLQTGQAFGATPAATYAAVNAARRNTDLPLWAKLPPHVPDIAAIAAAAEAAGADALTICNALPALYQDQAGMRDGKLSGPALRPIALRLVRQAATAVRIPVLGSGGVSRIEHVIEYARAGATAVQVGAAALLDPQLPVTLASQVAAEFTGLDHYDPGAEELAANW